MRHKRNTNFSIGKKYGGMTSKEVSRLKKLEAINLNLKKIVADLSFNNMA